MATVKFILQQPYKTAPKRVKAEHDAQGESVLNDTKKAKKRDRPLNPKETRLYAFLILGHKKVIKIKTEYVIYPKQWDFAGQGKKQTLAGASEFNKDLAVLKADIYDKYKAVLKEFPDMPFSQLARTLKEYGKTKEIPILSNDKDFFGYLKDYRTALEGEAEPGTVKKFVSIENSLKEFIKTDAGKKYELLTFSMIDHSFKDVYVKFLHSQPARGRMKTRPEGLQDGVLLATESKYIADIKTFLNWAEKRNYNRYTTYKEFETTTGANRKRKQQKNDIVTLSLSELMKFYSFEFPKDSIYEKVRDLWCFGAFTVQRWSDIEQFNKSQLKGDVWTFNAYKTKEEISLDLTGYFAPALDILKKYNYELPKFQLQNFNEQLKKAVEKAGITAKTKKTRYVGIKKITIEKPKCKFLSSHDARRTGISILLNEFNFPISHLMQITGHADLATLQVYINPDRQARREAVNKTKRIDEILTVVKEKTA